MRAVTAPSEPVLPSTLTVLPFASELSGSLVLFVTVTPSGTVTVTVLPSVFFTTIRPDPADTTVPVTGAKPRPWPPPSANRPAAPAPPPKVRA